jgi:hypothetical protein
VTPQTPRPGTPAATSTPIQGGGTPSLSVTPQRPATSTPLPTAAP